MTQLAGPDDLRRYVSEHSRRTLVSVALAAVVVSYYATWLTGDYGARLVGFVVYVLVAGYVLIQQPTPRAVIARALYLLAVLVLVTPVLLNLPILTGAPRGIEDPVGVVFHPGVVAFALVFVVIAAVVGGLGYWLDER